MKNELNRPRRKPEENPEIDQDIEGTKHVLNCPTAVCWLVRPERFVGQSGVRGGWMGRERVEDGVMCGTYCFLVQISSIRRGQCISDVI